MFNRGFQEGNRAFVVFGLKDRLKRLMQFNGDRLMLAEKVVPDLLRFPGNRDGWKGSRREFTVLR